ncbi:FtsX-like permease family protein [Tateyamaria omphalii]|uniref:FtsX-like permease family protein n=1 Tax=Tateyamaria omphalii TaxID=299262 RepID=UPI001C9911F8|nr:FtsX-like permease family protein [Tateyamaria omphalii]MBY5932618.1 FtsX-like permease family protein [Tateyamaria omphalii]
MTRACLAALMSHWRRNPLQLFAFLAGLALATALWSGVQAINAEARASYDAAAATLGEGQYDQIVPVSGDRIAQADFVTLRRAGWLVAPVIEGRLDGVRILGFDPLSSPAGFGTGQGGDPTLLLGDVQVIASEETAANLPPDISVNIDTGIAPNLAVTDIGVAQRLLGRDDLNRLLVLPAQPLVRPDLADVTPHLRLQPASQTADVGELTDSFHLNLTAFGLLSFAVGLFIVYSTIGLAFEQRRGVVRTLRALGVPLPQLIVLMVIEILLLALIGAGLGIILGYVVAAALLPDVAITLRGLYGAEVSGSLQFRLSWWGSGLAIAVLGALAAAAARLWRIARMPLLASARPRAWAMTSRGGHLVQGSCALVLFAAAGFLAGFGQGLLAGFALLGCFLIGAALILPVVISPLLRLAQNGARSPVARWFWADTRQQLPGLSLALMALLLAISANIGVATMVSSFRLTFVSFLDQRLAPELYVQTDGAAAAQEIEARLTSAGADVLPLLVVDMQVANQPARLFGVRVGPTYRNNWIFLDERAEAWDAVAAGTAVVVNEQLARRSGLWLDDQVEITPGRSLPIAAIVADYGNPKGQVIVGESLFGMLYPDVQPRQFGIRTDDAAGVREILTDQLNLPESAITNQAALKAFSLQVFERTFTVTAALNVLTLGVAGFAMLMSLLTLADLRIPQLAPVWALGLTRRSIGRLELLRTVVFAAVVFVFAIPVGLGLAWVLLAIINVEAFGWRLPMFLFPVDYGRLGIYALLAASAAAAWPAWRLMRTPPNALLKVFAHER